MFFFLRRISKQILDEKRFKLPSKIYKWLQFLLQSLKMITLLSFFDVKTSVKKTYFEVSYSRQCDPADSWPETCSLAPNSLVCSQKFFFSLTLRFQNNIKLSKHGFVELSMKIQCSWQLIKCTQTNKVRLLWDLNSCFSFITLSLVPGNSASLGA